ncbi:hypothetical protein V8C37DRAFT_392451 [Trichoderma ceciliae]
MYRSLKTDQMQLRRKYIWPEDREREEREEAERAIQTRPRFSSWDRFYVRGVPRTREEIKLLRNAKDDKSVSEDDDTEALLDCTREEWESSVMADCNRDQHVFKAESDLITEVLPKEDKKSYEKATKSTPPSPIEEVKEECSGNNGHIKATESLSEYDKDTHEEIFFKNENKDLETTIHRFSEVLQGKEEEEATGAASEHSLDNLIENLSHQQASRKRKRLDEDSGRERKRQQIG